MLKIRKESCPSGRLWRVYVGRPEGATLLAAFHDNPHAIAYADKTRRLVQAGRLSLVGTEPTC